MKHASDRNAVAQGQTLLTRVLAESSRRLVLRALFRRLLYLLAAVLVFPLLVVICDQAVPGGLSRPVIFGTGMLWLLGALLAIVGVSLRTLLSRLNRLYVARHVERSRGIRHNPLVNTILLQHAREVAYAREVADRQAVSALAAPGEPVPGSDIPLGRPASALLITIGLWLLYATVTPKPVLPSLARLFGAHRAAPVATRLELLRPGPDDPVYVGQPLELVFAASGRRDGQAEFALVDPRSPDAAPLLIRTGQPHEDPAAGTRYRFQLAAHEVASDLHYRCAVGDAVVTGVIAVQARPDLLELAIEVTPPAYTGELPYRTTQPDLRVRAGTRVTFAARANTDVVDPVFVLRSTGETRTRMAVDPVDRRRMHLALTPIESGDYWIEFADRWGQLCRDPMLHRVTVRRDAAPRITIISPSADEVPGAEVDVTHTAWLRAQASDDVELDAVSFVRDAQGTVSRTHLLDRQGADARRSMDVGVATSELGLDVGESVIVWFEARDNRVLPDGRSAPQTVTSRRLRLIRTPEDVPKEPGADANALAVADAVGSDRRTVTRQRSGTGEDGESGDLVDPSGRNSEGPVGPASPGTKYRSVPGSGDEEQQADARTQPAELDPDDVVGGEDSDRSQASDTQDEAEAAGSAGARQEFQEELREFNREHGAEAREVSRRCNRRPSAPAENQDQQASSSLEANEPDDAGGREGDEPGGGNESDAAGQGGANLESGDQPASRSPDSQPSVSNLEDRPTRQADSQQGADDATTRSKDDAHSGAEEEVSAKEAPQQQTNHEASAEKPQQHGGDETDAKRPRQPDAPEAETKPESESAGDQQPPHHASDVESPPPASPGAKQGERVIPMPGGTSPAERPPPEPGEGGEGGGLTAVSSSEPAADVTDTLELLRRADEPAEEDLLDLGWPPEQRRDFLAALERLRESARRAGVLTDPRIWRLQAELGSAEVSTGSGWSQDASTDVAGGTSGLGELEQIAPPAEQRISPELRAILDAYYESLAAIRNNERSPSAADSP